MNKQKFKKGDIVALSKDFCRAYDHRSQKLDKVIIQVIKVENYSIRQLVKIQVLVGIEEMRKLYIPGKPRIDKNNVCDYHWESHNFKMFKLQNAPQKSHNKIIDLIQV